MYLAVSSRVFGSAKARVHARQLEQTQIPRINRVLTFSASCHKRAPRHSKRPRRGRLVLVGGHFVFAAAAAAAAAAVYYRSSVLKYFVSKEFLLELNHH
jgi:hypothetical protein